MTPRVRMGDSADEARRTAAWLLGARGADGQRVLDQLWLRTILVEQRRRELLSSRPNFDERADRVLAALDPQPLPETEGAVA